MTTASPRASLRPAELETMTSQSPASVFRHDEDPKLVRLAKYPALELARRIYRWSLSSRRLVKRSSRIRASLLNLPRSNVGVRLAELDPTLDKSSLIFAIRTRNR